MAPQLLLPLLLPLLLRVCAGSCELFSTNSSTGCTSCFRRQVTRVHQVWRQGSCQQLHYVLLPLQG
jgi:hypothetical protein